MPITQTPYKRYQCNIWPEYRIRDLKFSQGILEVFAKKDADLVENTDNFGVLIWEIPLEERAVPVQKEFAHQGTQATQITEDQEAYDEEDDSNDENPAPDEVVILGGGYYEYKGVKVRGKKNLPPEAQGLV